MGESKVRVMDDNPDRTRPDTLTRRPWIMTIVGVVIGAIGVLVLSSVGSLSGEEPSNSSLFPTETASSIGAVVSSTTTVTTSTVATTTSPQVSLPEPNVMPEDGADDLAGVVAMTPSPGGRGGGTLWVLRPGGSVVRRDNVQFAPGDFPYPLLMTGGKIAFADGQSGYLADADLLINPDQLMDASFVVPSATPGQVWFVGPGVEWVAPVDAATEDVGERIEVADAIDWPLAAAADGLIVRPIDEAAYGPLALWTPNGGLDPITLDNPDKSHVIAASGSLAVIVEQDYVRVLDLATGDYVGRPGVIVGGDRLNIEACPSPDLEYVAVVGVTGDAYIMEVNTGVVLHRMADLQFPHAIGWTDTDQFVFIVNAETGTTVQTLDVSTGQPHIAATLTGYSAHWVLATNGSPC